MTKPENQPQHENRGRSDEARDPNRPLKLDENGNPIPVLDENGQPTGEFEKEGLGRRDQTTDTQAGTTDTTASQ